MNEFKKGDKVRMIKPQGYTFDRIGITGVVDEAMGNSVFVLLDSVKERPPIGRGWIYGREVWEKVEEKKDSVTVIRLLNGHKIVINKPYVIYTDGENTGKAKCNPADEFKTEIGLELAVERYKEAKTGRIFPSQFFEALTRDPISDFLDSILGIR